MKKTLLATSAIVALGGAAFADGHSGVSVAGYAEIGVADSGAIGSSLTFHQDIEVTFKMSGETDGGLSFGASVQLDEGGTTGAGTTPSDDQDYSVFIGGDAWKLSMGDTDGGFDKALTEIGMLTSIADDHTSHGGYNGNAGLDGDSDGQVLRLDYTGFDAFSMHVSVEEGATDDIMGLGAAFSTDLGGTSLAIGVGYQTQGDNDIAGVSVKAGIAGFDVVLNATSGTENGNDTSYTGIGLGYTVGDVKLHANFGENESGTTKTDGFGLAANYSLGGGATAMFGYSSSGTTDKMSLGLGLSF